jgi:hypothetical protein
MRIWHRLRVLPSKAPDWLVTYNWPFSSSTLKSTLVLSRRHCWCCTGGAVVVGIILSFLGSHHYRHFYFNNVHLFPPLGKVGGQRNTVMIWEYTAMTSRCRSWSVVQYEVYTAAGTTLRHLVLLSYASLVCAVRVNYCSMLLLLEQQCVSQCSTSVVQ